MVICIIYISPSSGKTFIVETLDGGSAHSFQSEAGAEYSEDDEQKENDDHNEDNEPIVYKETKDSMESKGQVYLIFCKNACATYAGHILVISRRIRVVLNAKVKST